MTDTPNRIDPTAAPSPTGIPIVSPKVVPWILAVVGIAAVAMQALPEHTIGYKVAAGIVALGALFGVASPGLRTKA
jgi:hypothetical protein